MSEDALLAQPRVLELRLLDPHLRTDVQMVEALLDQAFVEFGKPAVGTCAARRSRLACTRYCCRVPGRWRRMHAAGAWSGAVARSVDSASAGD